MCSKAGTSRDRQRLLTRSRSTLVAPPDEKAHFESEHVEKGLWKPWRSEEPEATPEMDAQVTAAEFPSPHELAKQAVDLNEMLASVAHDICIVGSVTESLNGTVVTEPEYQEKKLEFSRRHTDNRRKLLAGLNAALTCKKAQKPHQPNQDNISFCKIGGITLCVVADGHGPDGHWVSHYVIRFVLRLLLAEIALTSTVPGDGVLKRIFDLTHKALREQSKLLGFDLMMSGSTLSVCLIEHENKRVVVAWVGDSRCVVGKTDGSGGVGLTQDHKPNIDGERKRIVASGGEVLKLDGDVPHRVFIKNQELPGLAMSRALGDCIAHSIGVVHIPDIVRYEVEDHFVLCCSDGVWEFIDTAEAVKMVGDVGRERVLESVELLAQEARKRWLNEEGSTDDISAICIYV